VFIKHERVDKFLIKMIWRVNKKYGRFPPAVKTGGELA